MGPGGAAVYDRLPQDEVKSRLPESMDPWVRFARAMTLPFFLAPPHENPTFDLVLDNIDYIVKLVGWEHVAIGTDWPFMMSHHLAEVTIGTQTAELGFRPERGISVSRTTEGYKDARDFVNYTRRLLGRGYTDEQIKGILGENFLSLFEEVCG